MMMIIIMYPGTVTTYVENQNDTHDFMSRFFCQQYGALEKVNFSASIWSNLRKSCNRTYTFKNRTQVQKYNLISTKTLLAGWGEGGGLE